jgi:hypothetical protein
MPCLKIVNPNRIVVPRYYVRVLLNIFVILRRQLVREAEKLQRRTRTSPESRFSQS